MTARQTYRRQTRYNTKGNRVVKKKGVGSKVTLHKSKKLASCPKCGDCKKKLNGVKHPRPSKMGNIPKRNRKVFRAYGGSRCSGCVFKRIIRAFLIEEARMAKDVMAMASKEDRPKDASKKKKSKK